MKANTKARTPSKGGLAGMFDQTGGTSAPGGPITGQDFKDWSDSLRDVEEMLDDPKLRSDVAQIRQQAQSMRAEFKRHSKDPNWELVRQTISAPLQDLQQRLQEELARRTSPDSLVPIDRDPVPRQFSEMVREYYERLGSGQ